MRDYLDGLVERTVDRDSGIRPRVPSIFEPRQPLAEADAADETLKRAASIQTVDANTQERRTSLPPIVGSGPVTAAADVRSQTPPAREPARDDEQLTRRLAALERMARRDKAAQADVRRGDDRPSAPVSAARLEPTRDDAPKAIPHPAEPPRTADARSPRVPEIVDRTRPRAAQPEAPSALHRAAPPPRTTIAATTERGPRPVVIDTEPTPKNDAVIAAARHESPAPLMPRATSMRPVVDMRPRRQAVQPSRHTLVQVTIGRVEVRAERDTRPQPSSRVESGAPATLDEYMRRRHGAAR